MSNIDKQRIAAVRKLEAMGYVFHEHDWTGPAIPATFEADAMHALLVLRADALEGCPENSEGTREFRDDRRGARGLRGRYAGRTARYPAAKVELGQCATCTRSTCLGRKFIPELH